ncbi:glucan biosynthesis protein D [Novosphingobium profundi]|uniref:glucan biosynthesis protein n=1 Tax=Novosphingobium profundi TaxID=1774954 RepID=UPI001BDA493F|nr:glucan biosynthesis protein D [Novosphingobium profundi]MBT0670705.1 glucan biosynthesis protein D [Novosphingobium profundi]
MAHENLRATRRQVAGALPALALGFLLAPGALRAQGDTRYGAPEAFSWDILIERARDLAARPFAQRPPAPDAAPDFDGFGRLAYGQAARLGNDLRLFPATHAIAERGVDIHVLSQGQARRLIDAKGMFAHDKVATPAGFRVMNAPGLDTKGDWLAYLGGCYFRSAGQQDQYGLSARAIAIDTGLATPEEFPAFTAFWIEELGRDHVRILALLDGPALAGACSFDCRKGTDGVHQDVRLALFLRHGVTRLGLAPLTSMFWYDQSGPRADWRPEIHDSDGLAVLAGNGERIWRPLENAPHARTTSFRADHVKGFGLLQRDRDFAHYQDDGAFYDKRPSLWVEPEGDWGAGEVMLYEMPTASETQDNVVAFWVSDTPTQAGERRDLAYRLHWTSEEPLAGTQARCTNRFEGPAGRPGSPPEQARRKYVFDFTGPVLAGETRSSGVTAETDLPREAIATLAVYPVVGREDTWRVMLELHAEKAPRPEFRLSLRKGASALSETVIAMLRA